jgi:hypothetical protein
MRFENKACMQVVQVSCGTFIALVFLLQNKRGKFTSVLGDISSVHGLFFSSE